jgi:hypothetical protein
MPRKSEKKKSEPVVVDFTFRERIYQIDPARRKVYRRFVEIETAKALEILSVWRERSARA